MDSTRNKMIIPKKQIGTRKDSKGNDKPVYGHGLSDEERSKYKSIRYNAEIDAYEAELPAEEKLRAEFDQKLETRINQIAEAVASGARGQELAELMRK